MKKFAQAVFIIFCTLALGIALYYYLSARSGAAEARRPVATRKIELGVNFASSEERETAAERESSTNRISALPNEVILDVSTVNLDQDEGDEQILTVRKTDRPGGRLSIVVADYLPQRHAWVRAWEGDSLSTKLTTFSIQVKDLLGDHNLAIICTGMDDANAQTVTVFRRIPGPDSSVVSYSPISAIAADSIAIDELERTEGYQLGQTNGVSWPIVAFRRDKDSQNLLDQVKTTYSWDYKSAKYIEASSEKIAGAEVEREMAAKVLTGVEKDFENYLEGVWHSTNSSVADPTGRLIVFDRVGGFITFYSSEAQEVFTWSESHSTRYGLYIGCQNESVSNLRRLMDIELTGADNVSIRIFEDLKMKVDAEDRWDGSYSKLPVGSSGTVQGPARRAISYKLEGTYKAADGSELLFEGQSYAATLAGISEYGGFSSYSLGSDSVLELVALRGNGLVTSRHIYRLGYSEVAKGRSITRRLTLSPVRISITGLELTQEPDLSFEQTTVAKD